MNFEAIVCLFICGIALMAGNSWIELRSKKQRRKRK